MIFYQECENVPGRVLGPAETLKLLFERLEGCADVYADDPRYISLARKAGKGLTPHAFFQAWKTGGSLALMGSLRRIAKAFESLHLVRRRTGTEIGSCAVVEFSRLRPAASRTAELVDVLGSVQEGDVPRLCVLWALDVADPDLLLAGLTMPADEFFAAAELAIMANDPAKALRELMN